jgi:hypothetical protein
MSMGAFALASALAPARLQVQTPNDGHDTRALQHCIGMTAEQQAKLFEETASTFWTSSASSALMCGTVDATSRPEPQQ